MGEIIVLFSVELSLQKEYSSWKEVIAFMNHNNCFNYY